MLPSEALTLEGIDVSAIEKAPDKPIEGPRSEKRFSAPMLLVREQMDIPHALWAKEYLTYKNQIVGFAAPKAKLPELRAVETWLSTEARSLRAFVAAVSVKLFTQKATTLSAADVLALPYPESGTLDLSANEKVLIDDIVDYQRDLIRLGEDSAAMRQNGHDALNGFNEIFLKQINGIYKKNPLKALASQSWPGVICQAYAFGQSSVDWNDCDGLQGKLDNLLCQQRGTTLRVTRVARIYEGNFLFLLKPDRLRYWQRSIALRDADETLADLRGQGF